MYAAELVVILMTQVHMCCYWLVGVICWQLVLFCLDYYYFFWVLFHLFTFLVLLPGLSILAGDRWVVAG